MEGILNGASVPVIAAIVYWLINLLKYTTNNNEKLKTYIPLIAAVLGVICGLIAFLAAPDAMPTENIFAALVIGGASGLSATGFNQIIKQQSKEQ